MDEDSRKKRNTYYNRISQCNNQIDGLRNDLSALAVRLENLLDGQRKQKEKEESFLEQVSQEQWNIRGLLQTATINAAGNYCQDMSDVLEGVSYHRTQSAFEQIQTEISRAIEQIEYEIQSKRNRIFILQDEIDSLHRRIRNL